MLLAHLVDVQVSSRCDSMQSKMYNYHDTPIAMLCYMPWSMLCEALGYAMLCPRSALLGYALLGYAIMLQHGVFCYVVFCRIMFCSIISLRALCYCYGAVCSVLLHDTTLRNVDGRMDGRTDGRTDGWTAGRKDGRRDRMDGWMHASTRVR